MCRWGKLGTIRYKSYKPTATSEVLGAKQGPWLDPHVQQHQAVGRPPKRLLPPDALMLPGPHP